MTLTEIREYILDNLKKTGKKPETVIKDIDGDSYYGYLCQYRVTAYVRKGLVDHASPEYVSIMVVVPLATPKLKRPREESIDIDLESIIYIADAE